MTTLPQLEPMRMLDPATAEHEGWKSEGSQSTFRPSKVIHVGITEVQQ
jgi:hypothetical protein